MEFPHSSISGLGEGLSLYDFFGFDRTFVDMISSIRSSWIPGRPKTKKNRGPDLRVFPGLGFGVLIHSITMWSTSRRGRTCIVPGLHGKLEGPGHSKTFSGELFNVSQHSL